MNKLEIIEDMLDRFSLSYDCIEAEWMDDVIMVQSSEKEVLSEMYSWCVSNRVFATLVSADPYAPGMWELCIDPNY